MRAVKKYLAEIGSRGGKAGKGSPAKAASAKKANAARWKKYRESKIIVQKEKALILETNADVEASPPA